MEFLEEILELSSKLISFRTIYGDGGINDHAVFGQTIVDCQNELLNYCKSFGMQTYLDPQGMYSYAETASGEDYIAILCHLDIVTEGVLDKWTHPPYEAFIKDERIYGRGAADDKVPAAIAVMVVKYLLESNAQLKYPIRIIFGGDEETGFRCIEKYKKTHKAPMYTLVLDGTFPFSYAEKHLLNYELTGDSPISISGGDSLNTVMDFVKWDLPTESITMEGTSAHASRPKAGENALIKLAYVYSGRALLFNEIQALVYPDGQHKLVFVGKSDFEDVSLNIGKVEGHKLFVDIRVPPEIDLAIFCSQFEKFVRNLGLEPKLTDSMAGSKTDINSSFATTVLKCYREISGDMASEPFKTGSATYGRSFSKNCLSFGPRMGYHITNTHRANEFVSFELIEKAFEIYKHTLKTIEGEL